jgi:hypothetical protein
MYQVHLVMNGLELTIMGPKLQILHSSNWKTDTIYVFYLHVILIYVNVFPLWIDCDKARASGSIQVDFFYQ